MNTNQLNAEQLNSLQALSGGGAVADFDDLEFDNYSLQDSRIISTIIRDSSTPARELVTFRAPRTDGGGIIGNYFRERKILVSGVVKKDSAALLETELDTMKRRLTLAEGNLDRKINGTVRRIKATLSNPDQMFARRDGYHITICPFDLEFLALEPMWHDINYTSSTQTVTNVSFSETVENLGTYKSQAVLIVIIDTATAITAFQFSNTTSSQNLSITRSFSAGDVIIIDGENKSVKVNGTEVDYTGVFPELLYGSNAYSLTATGSAISYISTIKFKKTYL